MARVAPSLRWALAFLRGQRGTIVRNFPFEPREDSFLTVATDASPWGIGGVLFREGLPVAWFTDVLHPCDLERFQATVGDSAFTTLWETLAILVALRVCGRAPR